MSAIMGLLAPSLNPEKRRTVLASMSVRMEKTGSEPFADWASNESPVIFGIHPHTTGDLTPDGRQPAINDKLVALLDGFIANAPILRRELEDKGIKLKGHGDAELLAKATATFGLNRLLQKLEGSFAFALWDGNANALHLVRDRMGIKPLYICQTNDYLAFASSPDAFAALPDYTATLDSAAISEYLARGFITAPRTIYAGVEILPAGHRLMRTLADKKKTEPESWWSCANALEEIALRDISPNDNKIMQDRLQATLAMEAARADLPFTILDTDAAQSIRLKTILERGLGRPYALTPIKQPDGIAIQKAFETITRLAYPCAHPSAIPLLNSTFDESGVVLAPTATVFWNHRGHAPLPSLLPRPVRRMAAKWLPIELEQDAMDTHLQKHSLWTSKWLPDHTAPRMPMSEKDRAAYYDFCGPVTNRDIPLLDAVAKLKGQELRLPWADQRLLEWQIPAPLDLPVELSDWLRGPLRIRLQNAMSKNIQEKFGVEGGDTAMQKFFAGDNNHARKLWAYLTLAYWAAGKRLT